MTPENQEDLSVLEHQLAQLRELRELMDAAYAHYFDTTDGHCKGSEGYVAVHFNTVHDRRAGEPFKIARVGVYSYVLGPHRMHEFDSMEEALATVREWHAQEMANDEGMDRFLAVDKMFSNPPEVNDIPNP